MTSSGSSVRATTSARTVRAALPLGVEPLLVLLADALDEMQAEPDAVARALDGRRSTRLVAGTTQPRTTHARSPIDAGAVGSGSSGMPTHSVVVR